MHAFSSYIQLTLTGLVFFVLQGCTSAPEVISVLSYANCRQISAGVTHIQYSDIAAIRGSVMLDSSTEDSRLTQQNLVFLALSLGVQPSSGYQLSLSGPAKTVGTNLYIPVLSEIPPKNSTQTQMLTHPCLVVALEWQGNGKVIFVNQQDQIVGNFSASSDTSIPAS